MDCHIELVHPGRKNPPTPVNCSKSQWRKDSGDRCCIRCAEMHAKEVELERVRITSRVPHESDVTSPPWVKQDPDTDA